MNIIFDSITASWQLLLESAIYILFGLLVSGLLRSCLHPQSVFKQVGNGPISSGFKAPLFGIPIPL